MTDLVERLDALRVFLKSTDCLNEAETVREAANDILRLRRIVDALTVKLNKELTATYKIEERLTVAEQRMAKLFQMVTALRMNAT